MLTENVYILLLPQDICNVSYNQVSRMMNATACTNMYMNCSLMDIAWYLADG